MITIAWVLCTQASGADPVPLLGELEVTPEGFRASYDLTLFVRRDGNLFLEENLILDIDVSREVARLARERGPATRVVVAADAQTEYSRVVEVLDLVQAAGVGRIALEVGKAQVAEDPLFPGALAGEVVNLDQEEFNTDLEEYRPRRHKYPQNPYGSTDFTAYTGSGAKRRSGSRPRRTACCRGSTSAPRRPSTRSVRTTSRGRATSCGPYDAALSSSVYVVPVTNLLRSVDSDGQYNLAGYQVKDKQIFVDRVTYISFAIQNLIQVVGGWSIHAGVGYGRASAKGNIDFQNLPVIVLPGLNPIGGELRDRPERGRRGRGRAVRHRLPLQPAGQHHLQGAATVYGSARGLISADLDELPEELEACETWTSPPDTGVHPPQSVVPRHPRVPVLLAAGGPQVRLGAFGRALYLVVAGVRPVVPVRGHHPTHREDDPEELPPGQGGAETSSTASSSSRSDPRGCRPASVRRSEALPLGALGRRALPDLDLPEPD